MLGMFVQGQLASIKNNKNCIAIQNKCSVVQDKSLKTRKKLKV